MAEEKQILQCHSRGDKRFSALYAEVTIKGKKTTIEKFYQEAKRDKNGELPGKGKPFYYLDIFGKILPNKYASQFYLLLWVQYFLENKDLYDYACTFDDYVDLFKGKAINNQEDAIRKICKEGIDVARKECLELENILKQKDTLPIIQKDILQSKEEIVGHQTNCKGKMGAGIALVIRNAFPKAYDEYKSYCNIEDDFSIFGTCQVVKVEENKYVANIFGQYGYSRTTQSTNYDKVRSSLLELKKFAYENSLSVALPQYMGCKLGGGDWNEVHRIIEEVFYSDCKVPIVLYLYTQK